MPRITFIIGQEKKTVDAEEGATLLEIAQKNGIPMEAACGGNGFCATCKCRIVQGETRASPRNDREEAMGMTGNERLGCQAKVQGDLTVEPLGE